MIVMCGINSIVAPNSGRVILEKKEPTRIDQVYGGTVPFRPTKYQLMVSLSGTT
jgi:hypothetical protein